MRKALSALGLGAALTLGTIGVAQAQSYYGYQSPNLYSRDGMGGYRGYNPGTGSTWSGRSDGFGQRGFDARGNIWSYDRNSGVYHNYGTGEMRYRGQRIR